MTGPRATFSLAPASGVPRAVRFQAPSGSVNWRSRRSACSRRQVASGSGSAAAFAAAHAARSSVRLARLASPTRRASAAGLADAASTTARAWGADRVPSRRAASARGVPDSFSEVSSCWRAPPTEPPSLAARYSAAER